MSDSDNPATPAIATGPITPITDPTTTAQREAVERINDLAERIDWTTSLDTGEPRRSPAFLGVVPIVDRILGEWFNAFVAGNADAARRYASGNVSRDIAAALAEHLAPRPADGFALADNAREAVIAATSNARALAEDPATPPPLRREIATYTRLVTASILSLADAVETTEAERARLAHSVALKLSTDTDREGAFAVKVAHDPTGMVRILANHFADVLESPSSVNLRPEDVEKRALPGYAPLPSDTPPAKNYVEMVFKPSRGPSVVVTVRRCHGKTPADLQREAEAQRDAARAERDAAEAQTESYAATLRACTATLECDVASIPATLARVEASALLLADRLGVSHPTPIADKLDVAAQEIRRAQAIARSAALLIGVPREYVDAEPLSPILERIEAHARPAGSSTRGFLAEVEALCRRYGLSLAHEDEHGSFVVRPLDERWIDFLRAASDEARTAPQHTATKE